MDQEHPPDRRLTAEEVAGREWAEWYLLSPMERWEASQRLWPEYLALDGSLEPEVDTQSPFWSEEDLREFARSLPDARSGAGTDATTHAVADGPADPPERCTPQAGTPHLGDLDSDAEPRRP